MEEDSTPKASRSKDNAGPGPTPQNQDYKTYNQVQIYSLRHLWENLWPGTGRASIIILSQCFSARAICPLGDTWQGLETYCFDNRITGGLYPAGRGQ